MFSGIIEEVGKITRKSFIKESIKLEIKGEKIGKEISEGESISVNGVCLTVEKTDKNSIFSVSLSPFTQKETNLGKIKVGEKVNLERAVKLGDKIGGHFLSGHIDFQSKFLGLNFIGENAILKIKIPQEFRKYFIKKGCIGVDGISLTISEIKNEIIEIYLVPYTLKNTNLKEKKIGTFLNIEIDIMAKYIENIAKELKSKNGEKFFKFN